MTSAEGFRKRLLIFTHGSAQIVVTSCWWLQILEELVSSRRERRWELGSSTCTHLRRRFHHWLFWWLLPRRRVEWWGRAAFQTHLQQATWTKVSKGSVPSSESLPKAPGSNSTLADLLYFLDFWSHLVSAIKYTSKLSAVGTVKVRGRKSSLDGLFLPTFKRLIKELAAGSWTQFWGRTRSRSVLTVTLTRHIIGVFFFSGSRHLGEPIVLFYESVKGAQTAPWLPRTSPVLHWRVSANVVAGRVNVINRQRSFLLGLWSLQGTA